MISVIVPVYNVEPYLRKCLDSVVGQTYRDLEILIIDDGSTDGSGIICDEYKVDERVKVFHTENRGLSAARNLGLDEATGDWIGFVDSDDWIEPDMYEVLIDRALEAGADVVECGWFQEYEQRAVKRKYLDQKLSGADALSALIHGSLSDVSWDKVWKKRCFEEIRFPENRVYEDIAITYKIFEAAGCVVSIETCKYHYLQRAGSLTRRTDIRNLTGYWLSQMERYEELKNRVDDEEQKILLRFCALAASRTWSNYCDCSLDEQDEGNNTILEMHTFTKQHFPLFGDRRWNLVQRLGVFFPHYMSPLSFRTAWLINRVYQLFNKAT